jgi:hypothetical protein
MESVNSMEIALIIVKYFVLESKRAESAISGCLVLGQYGRRRRTGRGLGAPAGMHDLLRFRCQMTARPRLNGFVAKEPY